MYSECCGFDVKNGSQNSKGLPVSISFTLATVNIHHSSTLHMYRKNHLISLMLI